MIGEVESFAMLMNPLLELGAVLMEKYGKAQAIHEKTDQSPVTKMDLFAHHRIFQHLKKNSKYPVVSEESFVSYEERRHWSRFWLVDPLDGTKAYIKGKGDFTINIALIENGRPIEAIIFSPSRREFYFAKLGLGAYVLSSSGKETKLPCVQREQPALFRSSSHEGEMLNQLQIQNPHFQPIPLSSAIKFCLVAKEDPACYLRFAGSSEWDVAAGDLIVSESGGEMVAIHDQRTLRYNTEAMRPPSFIAFSKSLRKESLDLIQALKKEDCLDMAEIIKSKSRKLCPSRELG